MTMLWIAAWILGGIAGLWVVGTLIGKGMPREHRSQAVVLVHRPQAEVFDVVADVERYPTWAKVTGVTRLPDQEGRAAYRIRFGHVAAIMVITRREPPSVFEVVMVEEKRRFLGTWTYEFKGEAGGCGVTLSERGEIPKGFPRFVMYTFVGPASNIRRHLGDLAKQLGRGGGTGGG